MAGGTKESHSVVLMEVMGDVMVVEVEVVVGKVEVVVGVVEVEVVVGVVEVVVEVEQWTSSSHGLSPQSTS